MRFIVSYQGVTRPGLVDREHLVSTGVDLIPTLCDFAGIATPEGLTGRSARPLAEGSLFTSGVTGSSPIAGPVE